MTFAGRLAFASPILLTALWAGGLTIAIFRAQWLPLAGLAELAILVLPTAWAWAIYAVCRQVLRKRAEPVGRADWIFALTIGGALTTILLHAISGTAEKSDIQSNAEMPVVLGFFVSVGIAGRALDRAERATAADAFSRGLLNAIILLFEPIGFWVLKPRLAALRAMLDA